MIVKPSQFPGMHERHLLRKTTYPALFPVVAPLNDENLLEVQRQDHEQLQAFLHDFQALLQQAALLDSDVDSDAVLQLKHQLEQAYERAALVGDDQSKNKQALAKLIQLMMTAVRNGAGSDHQAQSELDQEEAARTAHFQLLESALVADLLSPDSVIQPQELSACLLCAEKDDLALVVQLFDGPQLQVLLQQCQPQVTNLGVSETRLRASQNLTFIEGYIKAYAMT